MEISLTRIIIELMQVTTGTVVNGKIVIEGVPLVEGEVVAVLSRGAGEDFRLSEAQEDDLLAAIAEIDRGEFETLAEVMSSLPSRC